MSDNIILIGYRGSGKSAVARRLGQKLNRAVISTDERIEDKVGPIKEFVKTHGWQAFRSIEQQIIKEIKAENAIIDCGGGVIESSENIKILKHLGIIFWLKARVAQLQQRIKNNLNRPALSDGKSYWEEVPDILTRREPMYRTAADHIVNTQKKSVETLAAEIIQHLNQ